MIFLFLVRLVGTERNAREGRLEVYYNETWGTVCDNGFNDIAAKVACNGLGFGYVVKSCAYNVYGVISVQFLKAVFRLNALEDTDFANLRKTRILTDCVAIYSE